MQNAYKNMVHNKRVNCPNMQLFFFFLINMQLIFYMMQKVECKENKIKIKQGKKRVFWRERGVGERKIA